MIIHELNASWVTIILTTHYLEEAETLCRNVAIIDKGTIVKSGPIRELLASMEDEVMSIELDRPFSGSRHSDEGRIHASKKMNPGSFVPQDDGKGLLQDYTPVVHDTVVDLTVSATHTLDDAIKILQKEDYKIKTLKPKSGRLEEFFLKSTGK